MQLAAEVKDTDEGELYDNVAALRDQAAREARERLAIVEEECRRQHEEVQEMVRRVKERDAEGAVLPDEVLERQLEQEEKSQSIIDGVRIRRGRPTTRSVDARSGKASASVGGKRDKRVSYADDAVDEADEAPVNAIRRQEVELARQQAAELAAATRRRDEQLLHRQTHEMDEELRALQGRSAHSLADQIARRRRAQAVAATANGGPGVCSCCFSQVCLGTSEFSRTYIQELSFQKSRFWKKPNVSSAVQP